MNDASDSDVFPADGDRREGDQSRAGQTGAGETGAGDTGAGTSFGQQNAQRTNPEAGASPAEATDSGGDGGESGVVQPEIVSAGVLNAAPDESSAGVNEKAKGRSGSGDELNVESPAKIIRVGAMVKQLLEEVRLAPMDDSARDHLREIYEQSVEELKSALSPELADELERLAPDFDGENTPSDASLRIAQAQLVGWLEGLFHGIQATLFAQQVDVRQQLEASQVQLGAAAAAGGQPPSAPGAGGPSGYL